ncbi:hypothetical protein Taro_052829 [Colocasia esculenta]|uniref:CCHC-type domain-containing protein n=1 Tax=Colocasia esculenta TaxID=4460 RepID=A0A843XL80_COLES|nr:hypothetical protein [Colocasia esculenta]
MAAQGHSEGQSVNRPPLFDGEDYAYWKTRMEYFLQGLDYQIWSIVEEGDLLVTNEKNQWTDDDRKKISLNCKAKSILCCAFSKKEFNCVSTCKSTMEMWEKLRITYDGTDKVKETRIDILSGRRHFRKNKDFKKPDEKDQKKGKPICYECKKLGHIKAECPKFKKPEFRKKESSKKFRRHKKKAMAAAWSNSSDSDSESSSSSDEEEANLAFMTNAEEKI